MMRKPNIIYFMSDQHNASVLGCAGDPYVKTPHMDKLAASGTMLENCYTNSPLCGASRASMLSGSLPSEPGINTNLRCLPSDTATSSHALSVAWNESDLSGRMHSVGPVHRHGFDERHVGWI